MFLNLLSEIEVGYLKTRSINSVVIQSSWKQLTDTCEITLPTNIIRRNENYTDLIKLGDPITVSMSVDGIDKLKPEFYGYVVSKSDHASGKIYCEDEMYILKKRKIAGKSWSNAKIEEILDYIVKDYEVVISESMNANITLGKFKIDSDATAAKAIYSLKDYGIHCFFRDKVLYVGLANDHSFNRHIFDLNRNIVTHNLTRDTWRERASVQIKATSFLPSGGKVVLFLPKEAPENSVIRTRNFGSLSNDPEEAKRLMAVFVKQEVKESTNEGYTGSLTCFGIHNVKHGDEVKIFNGKKNEYGVYLVDKVTTSFGEVYMRRVVDIGLRIS